MVAAHTNKVLGLIRILEHLLAQMERHDFILRAVQYQYRIMYTLYIGHRVKRVTQHHQAGQKREYGSGKVTSRAQR